MITFEKVLNDSGPIAVRHLLSAWCSPSKEEKRDIQNLDMYSIDEHQLGKACMHAAYHLFCFLSSSALHTEGMQHGTQLQATWEHMSVKVQFSTRMHSFSMFTSYFSM